MKKTKKINKFTLGVVIAIVWGVFAFIPEYFKFSLLPTGGWDWLGFVGIILGSLIALEGVTMTIENENINNRELEKSENQRMREQQQMSVLPCLDIPIHTIKEYESGGNNVFRVFKDDKEQLINDGYIIGEQKPERFKLGANLKVRNIGLSTAFSINTFIYKLDKVEGLESLDKIEIEKRKEIIDNFYEKIKASNYTYIEDSNTFNNEWQIYTTFNLTNDDRSEINFIFDFSGIEGKFYNILEFRYSDIYENHYYQLLYLYFDKDQVSFMPISKVFLGKSHKI